MAAIILVLFQVLFSYISSKILSKNLKLSAKEILYVIISGSFTSFMYQYINIFTNLLTFLVFVILWNKKINIYEFIIFSSFSMIIHILNTHISALLKYELFKDNVLSLKELFLLYIPLYYIIGFFFSFVGSMIMNRVLYSISPVFLSVLSCFI